MAATATVLKLPRSGDSPELAVRSARAADRVDEAQKLGLSCRTRYAFEGFGAPTLELFSQAHSMRETDAGWSVECDSPVFFEQTEYMACVDFPEETAEARLFSPLASWCEKADWDGSGRLSLPLNFGNDLGDFELCFEWRKEGESAWRRASMRAQVLSYKLDIGTHFRAMLGEVKAHFDWLRLDLLRTTYWAWGMNEDAEATLESWLLIFQQVRGEMSGALEELTERHRKRLTETSRRLPADRIRKLPPRLEERVAETLKDRPDSRFSVAKMHLSADTPENRYIKHLMTLCVRRLGEINERLAPIARVSSVFKERLAEWEQEWARLRLHPFWRGIGEFHGMRGESQILSQDPLYARVRRNWRWLQHGVDLLDQDLKGGIQNAAQLYEVWCLIQLDKYLLDGRGGDDPLWRSEGKSAVPFDREDDDFGSEAKRTGTIKLRYKSTRNSEVALDLLFQPTASAKPNTAHWNGMMSVPETQCPDLVLRLERGDLPHRPVYTWIFDAKYRLGNTGAPEDAVNGMHRYRDAILWAADSEGEGKLTRESLGAFVLYPGEELKGESQGKSIDRVNIGAFSLKPPEAIPENGTHAIAPTTHLREKLDALLKVDPPAASGDRWMVRDGEYFDAVPMAKSPVGSLVVSAAIRSHMDNEAYWVQCRLYRLPIASARQIYAPIGAWGWIIPTGADGKQYGMFPVRRVEDLSRRKVVDVYQSQGVEIPIFTDPASPDYRDPHSRYLLFHLGDPVRIEGQTFLPTDRVVAVSYQAPTSEG